MINLIFFIALTALLIYLYFLLRFMFKLKKHEKLALINHVPVTIICSARNEEHNISAFIEAIKKQNYDKNLIQLIIVDDQSTDKTLDIIESYKNDFLDYSYFTSKDREKVISAKKNALSQAIQLAKYEIILTSDADCNPSPDWVNGMVDVYLKYPETSMVIGFSETDIALNDNRFYLMFEHFDFHVLMFATAGSVNNDKYFSCSGQNLSYRKSAFLEVGGYSSLMHLISGDDLHLMQLFRNSKMKIRFANNLDSYVKTKPVNSLKNLFNQRSRWASNMKYMLLTNPEFFVYLCSTFLILTFLPVLLILDTKRALMLAVTKIICDFLFINKAYKCFQLKNRIVLNFTLWTLFQPVYTLVVGVLGSVSLFKWKDRRGF